MRINGNHVTKPAANVGARRGPATEAQTLYEDLTPKDDTEKHVPPIARIEGNSRPTKRDRRKLDLDRRGALE